MDDKLKVFRKIKGRIKIQSEAADYIEKQLGFGFSECLITVEQKDDSVQEFDNLAAAFDFADEYSPYINKILIKAKSEKEKVGLEFKNTKTNSDTSASFVCFSDDSGCLQSRGEFFANLRKMVTYKKRKKRFVVSLVLFFLIALKINDMHITDNMISNAFGISSLLLVGTAWLFDYLITIFSSRHNRLSIIIDDEKAQRYRKGIIRENLIEWMMVVALIGAIVGVYFIV